MLFYYIRHGDPIYKPDSLTPLGERQAEAISKRLCLYGLDRIYASTSNRAVLTATPTAEILKKEIVQLDFANEGHAWNDFTLKSGEKMTWLFQSKEARALFHTEEITSLGFKWYEHPELAPYNYKKGIDRIASETDAFFESLGYRREGLGKYKVISENDERIALFAHQGFGLAFLSHLLGIPYPTFSTKFDFGHSGLTVIDFKNEDGYAYPRVLTLANDSHLYREGLPTKYQNQIYF